MLFASLFASVARSLTHGGHAKMSRQEEPCPLLKLPSDLYCSRIGASFRRFSKHRLM